MRLPLLVLLLLALAVPSVLAQETMLHAIDQDGQYVFQPDRLEVAAGAEIAVMMFGAEPHAVRSTTGAWSDVDLAPNEEGTFNAPTAPGEYPFYCFYHGTPDDGMRGVLVVQGASEGEKGTPLGALLLVTAGAAAAALLRRR